MMELTSFIDNSTNLDPDFYVLNFEEFEGTHYCLGPVHLSIKLFNASNIIGTLLAKVLEFHMLILYEKLLSCSQKEHHPQR